VSSIARGLERILGDDGHAARLRERGLRRAAGYTLEKQAAATLQVYESVLGASA
jgi:glycosyltransferase involved in cell wall biosynthesis